MNTRSKIIIPVVIIVASLGLFFWILPGQVILPQTIEILGWPLRIYGLILGLAILDAYFLARKRAENFGFERAQLDNIALVLISSGLLGARLYHVVSSWEYYSSNLGQVLMVWEGGLSIFGAVLGGLIGLWIYQRSFLTDTSLGQLLDWLTPSLVLGQIIGRFGNLFNYEAYGSPTTLPWKMFVPEQFRLPAYEAMEFFHPTFLYEALAGGLILLILLNFPKLSQFLKLPRFKGEIFWSWLLLYGLVRIFTESLRLDSPYLGTIKQNLIVAILMVLVSLIIFVVKKFNFKNESITS